MIIVRTDGEVTYITRIPAEMQIIKMILAHLRIEFSVGISSDGSTVGVSLANAERFEEEAREWLEAIATVVSCVGSEK